MPSSLDTRKPKTTIHQNLVRRYRRHVLPQPFLMHNRNLNLITKNCKQDSEQYQVAKRVQKLRCNGWCENECNNRQTTSWAHNIPITSNATKDWRNFQIPGQWGQRQAANCQIEHTVHKRSEKKDGRMRTAGDWGARRRRNEGRWRNGRHVECKRRWCAGQGPSRRVQMTGGRGSIWRAPGTACRDPGRRRRVRVSTEALLLLVSMVRCVKHEHKLWDPPCGGSPFWPT